MCTFYVIKATILYAVRRLDSYWCRLHNYCMSMEKCAIGQMLDKACHQKLHTSKKTSRPINELSEANINLLMERTSIPVFDVSSTICAHHENVYIWKYEIMQSKYCADPDMRHKYKIKASSENYYLTVLANDANICE